MKNGTAPLKNGTAPHHLALQGASPRGEAAKRLTIFALLCVSTMRQGEALTQGKASHFCRRKFCERNFMQARGSREEADNFCRKKMKALNFFQTRGRQAKTSSVGRSRQLPRRGSRERGLSIKRLFDEKMPDCCSAAPHHLALQGASPQGEAAKRLTIFVEKNEGTEFFSGKGKP